MLNIRNWRKEKIISRASHTLEVLSYWTNLVTHSDRFQLFLEPNTVQSSNSGLTGSSWQKLGLDSSSNYEMIFFRSGNLVLGSCTQIKKETEKAEVAKRWRSFWPCGISGINITERLSCLRTEETINTLQLTTSVKRYSPCCSHPISNTYFPGPTG